MLQDKLLEAVEKSPNADRHGVDENLDENLEPAESGRKDSSKRPPPPPPPQARAPAQRGGVDDGGLPAELLEGSFDDSAASLLSELQLGPASDQILADLASWRAELARDEELIQRPPSGRSERQAAKPPPREGAAAGRSIRDVGPSDGGGEEEEEESEVHLGEVGRLEASRLNCERVAAALEQESAAIAALGDQSREQGICHAAIVSSLAQPRGGATTAAAAPSLQRQAGAPLDDGRVRQALMETAAEAGRSADLAALEAEVLADGAFLEEKMGELGDELGEAQAELELLLKQLDED